MVYENIATRYIALTQNHGESFFRLVMETVLTRFPFLYKLVKLTE